MMWDAGKSLLLPPKPIFEYDVPFRFFASIYSVCVSNVFCRIKVTEVMVTPSAVGS